MLAQMEKSKVVVVWVFSVHYQLFMVILKIEQRMLSQMAELISIDCTSGTRNRSLQHRAKRKTRPLSTP